MTRPVGNPVGHLPTHGLLDFIEKHIEGGASRLGNVKEHDTIEIGGCGSLPLELYNRFIFWLFMLMLLV